MLCARKVFVIIKVFAIMGQFRPEMARMIAKDLFRRRIRIG